MKLTLPNQLKSLFGISPTPKPVRIKRTENNDTNNGWGFGGVKETITTYTNGYKSKIGKEYFNNAPDKKFEKYFDNTGREISKEQFKRAITN